MLKLHVMADSVDDEITPINIASALMQYDNFNVDELIEIADHLYAYARRVTRRNSERILFKEKTNDQN